MAISGRSIIGLLRHLPLGTDLPMTILEHLEELRRRILFAVAGLFVAMAVGLWLEPQLLTLLMHPVGLTHLVALTVLEPLLFVAPALNDREARYVVPIAMLALVLSIVGVLFGYFFIMPPSTRWLVGQAGTAMSLQLTALSYISYALLFLAAVALTFQTPLVVLALVGLGVISRTRLRQEWRAVYMTITVVAAVITPDWSPVTMLLVAGAMVALYELSLLLGCLIFPLR